MNCVPQVVRRKCGRCQKFRDPREFLTAARYCLHCYEHHRIALDVLGGSIPHGCVDCCKSVQQLSDSQPGADMRLSVVMMDGLYAVLCPTCADRFEKLNPLLIQGTPYGASKRIQ